MSLPFDLASEAVPLHDPQPDLPSDEELIANVLAGDMTSFAMIMRRYNQRVFRTVRSILRDHSEAEDALQQTFVSAFESLQQFAGRAKFSTWLTRIAIYEAFSWLRSHRFVRFVDLHEEEFQRMAPAISESSAIDDIERDELGKVLHRAIDSLPDDLRTVFTLRLVEEMSTDETAECLNLTPANVKVRLHRARLQLRSQIERQIGSELRQLYQFNGQRCERSVRAVMERLSLL